MSMNRFAFGVVSVVAAICVSLVGVSSVNASDIVQCLDQCDQEYDMCSWDWEVKRTNLENDYNAKLAALEALQARTDPPATAAELYQAERDFALAESKLLAHLGTASNCANKLDRCRAACHNPGGGGGGCVIAPGGYCPPECRECTEDPYWND